MQRNPLKELIQNGCANLPLTEASVVRKPSIDRMDAVTILRHGRSRSQSESSDTDCAGTQEHAQTADVTTPTVPKTPLKPTKSG